MALLAIAHSAIDISDGLAADLGHILAASHVGASVQVEALPCAPELTKYLPHKQAVSLALSGGDDYELCFTAPRAKAAMLSRVFKKLQTPLTPIGIIEKRPGLRLWHEKKPFKLSKPGYEHFAKKS
jgi:thiamine-monophosphate kinase